MGEYVKEPGRPRTHCAIYYRYIVLDEGELPTDADMPVPGGTFGGRRT